MISWWFLPFINLVQTYLRHLNDYYNHNHNLSASHKLIIIFTQNLIFNPSYFYAESDQCLVTITLDSFSYKMFSSSFDNLSGFGTDTATRSKFIVAMTKTLWPIIDEQMRSQLSVSLTEYYNDQLQQLKVNNLTSVRCHDFLPEWFFYVSIVTTHNST